MFRSVNFRYSLVVDLNIPHVTQSSVDLVSQAHVPMNFLFFDNTHIFQIAKLCLNLLLLAKSS